MYWGSDRGSGGMNVWRAPIDEASGRFIRPPEPVTMPSPYAMHFSFARDGRRLAYVQMIRRLNIARIDFDPAVGRVAGGPAGVLETSRPTTGPDLSPDGLRLVLDSQSADQEDILVADVDGSHMRKLTNDTFKDRGPAWSPDGEWIAFFSNRGGKTQIWMIKPDGSALHQVTAAAGAGVNTPIWAPDGRRLAYC